MPIRRRRGASAARPPDAPAGAGLRHPEARHLGSSGQGGPELAPRARLRRGAGREGGQVHRARAPGRRAPGGHRARARDVRAAARQRRDRGLPRRARRGAALMRWGVVVFPGSNDDRDALRAAERVLGDEAVALWHKDRTLGGADCVVLPGGFSYGDYLRCGALAKFSPIMDAVARHAREGGLVLGICNGFQILCEAGLLPGALIANRSLSFVCDFVTVRVETTDTFFTHGCREGEVLELPIKHGEGSYVADEGTLAALEHEQRVVFRYTDRAGRPTPEANPNGALRNIAGVCNAGRNVIGLMPHPEHAVERLTGSVDGLRLFRSAQSWVTRGAAAAPARSAPG